MYIVIKTPDTREALYMKTSGEGLIWVTQKSVEKSALDLRDNEKSLVRHLRQDGKVVTQLSIVSVSVNPKRLFFFHTRRLLLLWTLVAYIQWVAYSYPLDSGTAPLS